MGKCVYDCEKKLKLTPSIEKILKPNIYHKYLAEQF